MKKLLSALSAIVLLSVPVMAQRVLIDDYEQLKVHFFTPQVTVTEGEYLLLSAENYVAGGEVGAPMLPVCNSLLTVPFCEGMIVEVTNAEYDTIALPSGRVMPLQPSRCKSDLGEPRIVIDESIYATNAYFSRPLARVKPLGIGRDRNYALLTWSPVSINPVSGQMIVCRNADVTVHYQGSNVGATLKYLDRYYTPAFSLAPTLNTLFSSKDVRVTAPIRMVVMAAQSLQCSALDEFVEWKRRQGMLVDLLYVPNSNTPQANSALLQQMYDDASDAAPAPTYILLVGDHGQLQAFPTDMSSSSLSIMQAYADLTPDHITDHYYATWTADNLPDCYQGRFSATDTNTVRKIVEKTIYYEQYQFMSDNYLGRAALISGYDNGYGNDRYDNAWRCADPSMDYIAMLYINTSHGYDTVYYYKNDPNYAPAGVSVTGSSLAQSTPSTLRARYNEGVGWVNYSAHGDWNCWYRPSFTTSHANQMSNNDMPSFMIGSCCLTNKFDEGTCLGEALLRKGNRAGAVGYIGATNVTFWGEDFYWTVGLRSSISHTMNLAYDGSRKGMYDRLFHTHGEALADQMVTAGQILMAGNMSVARADGSSSWATAVSEYYWEIYELMGDPSLLPWMGKAADLQVSSVVNNISTIDITAVPGAYVALVHRQNYTLASSAFAGADGVASLPASSIPLDSCYISITAQGYKPYLKAYSSHNVGLNTVAVDDITVAPNPANASTEVRGEGLRRVTLLNVMGQSLQTVLADADRCAINLTSVPVGLYLLRIESAAGTTVRKLVVN